jgi:hypothetical protein
MHGENDETPFFVYTQLLLHNVPHHFPQKPKDETEEKLKNSFVILP